MPGTSVLIATRNRPDALRRCLDALAAGACPPAEIVVVDQSDDERTRAVADGYDGPGRMVYARQRGSGLGRAQNLGFARASGEVIAVTDDDCVADSGWLERIEAELARRPEVAAVCGRVLPLPVAGAQTEPVASRTSAEPRRFAGRCLPWLLGSGNNFAVRRSWFVRIGGCDERLGPGTAGRGAVDMDLFYRLLRAGAVVRYEPACLVHHERATPAGRRARRFPYGYGMGACCAFALLDGDVFALRMLGRWLALRLRALRGADSTGAREELLVLAGTLSGLAHPLRLLV
jgi:glycosyltransferase involved in cell wall biosynthesis